MAIQFSDGVRNGRLDSLETTIGTAPKLQLRSGAAPANCAAADSGTLLCEITLPSDWMAAASGGSKAGSSFPWTGTGAAAGAAAHFRLKNNAGSTTHMQGTVGLSASDLIVDNTSIGVGQTVNVTAFTLTDGNA